MALIVCKDCKQEFSTDAKKCPNCGAKKPPKEKSRLSKALPYLFLIAFIPQVAVILAEHEAVPLPQSNPASQKSSYKGPVTGKMAFMCARYADVLRFVSYINEGNQSEALEMVTGPLSYGEKTGGCLALAAGEPIRIVRTDGLVARVEFGSMFGFSPLSSIDHSRSPKASK